MNDDSGLIIILGSPNDVHGNLSTMGRGRVECGFQEYLAKKETGWKILLTGGFGEHFNTTSKPNAYYASKILTNLGVPAIDIVEFAESRDTVDDALQARLIVERRQIFSLLIVSSDFHLDRVRYIFGEVFPDIDLSYSTAPYIDQCTSEERHVLLAHERREIESLRDSRVSSLVGINLDAWKLR